MGDIYRNALLTIAATGANKATDGILLIYSEDDEDLNPSIYLPATADSGHIDRVVLTRKKNDEEGLHTCMYSNPLARRAWALQERILSHRVLYYGRRQFYWQCQQARWSADATPEIITTKDLFSSLLMLSDRGQGSVDNASTSDIYMEWYNILRLYCGRKLTYETDKLPAVGGLATQIQKLTGDQYLAGIWRNDIHRGLLWHVDIPPITLRNHRAPSWSWARWDGELIMDGEGLDRIPCDEEMRLLESEVEFSGENEYGEVRSGWLRVNGLVRKIWVSKKEYGMREFPSVATHLYILEENGPLQEINDASLYMDSETPLRPIDSESTRSTKQTGLSPQPTYISTNEGDEFTLLFIAKYGFLPPRENYPKGWLQALVLLPVEGRQATFRRCGILSMSSDTSIFINGWKNWVFEDLTMI